MVTKFQLLKANHFQKINSQIVNPAKINETKKNIARLKTLLKGKINA